MVWRQSWLVNWSARARARSVPIIGLAGLATNRIMAAPDFACGQAKHHV